MIALSPTGDSQELRLSFDDLPLAEIVRAGVRAAGFTHCTPIQAKVLPFALAGRDVAGQAQTGTGKTAAFLITVFTRLIERPVEARPGAPRALVIAPTRELAVQISNDAMLLGSGNGLTIQAVYGGVDYRKQRESLRNDVDILIGTPGRLIDYLKQGVYDLRSVEALVVDEADRMFDMGFIRDLRFLLRRCPPADKRQSMLFSATLSHDVMELAYVFLNDAVRIEVKPEQVTAEGVDHLLYHVGQHEKIPALLGVLRREGVERTLVFVNMRRTADRLCRTLAANSYRVEQITGDIDQRRRLRILEDFREGTLPILVATDVASRGLHIEGVTHVINYDLPFDAEDYVHRVGRTARAGASGKAISLACESYVEGLPAIEKLIGFKLPVEHPDDDLLVKEFVEARRVPRSDRSGRPGSGARGGSRPRQAHSGSGQGPGGERRGRSRARSSGAAEGASSSPSSDAPRPRRSRERESGTEQAPASPAAASPEGSAAAPKRRRRRRRRSRDGGAGGAKATGPATSHERAEE